MSEEDLKIGILLDTRQAKQELRDIEGEKKEMDKGLEETRDKARDTMMMTFGVVRSSYQLLRGTLRAAGITIDAVTNATIQSLINVGQQFYKLATAKAVTPGMQAAAVVTFIQSAIIIAQAMQYEKESKEISRNIETTNAMLNGINGIIGSINF